MNAGRHRFRQLLRQIAVQTVFRPQHFTARCHRGGQLNQRILFVIRPHSTRSRGISVSVAFAGRTRQQTLRASLRQLAVLLCDSAQLRTFSARVMSASSGCVSAVFQLDIPPDSPRHGVPASRPARAQDGSPADGTDRAGHPL